METAQARKLVLTKEALQSLTPTVHGAVEPSSPRTTYSKSCVNPHAPQDT